MTLLELLRKCGVDGDVDFLREALQVLVQSLMEAEVSAQIGAERYERNENRTTYRNGYRERPWDTRVGTLKLTIPKLRQGSYFPSLLEPRRRAEKALLAVVQEAYVHGVSTRKVDELVEALGMRGISKSEVSRICKELDEVVLSFKERPLDGAYPYVWLDATFPKMREGGRVRNMALVLAIGVRDNGEREVLGFDLGLCEDGAFWTDFLRRLAARGLRGVELVISDAHEGLKQAIEQVLTEATWQRCRVQNFPKPRFGDTTGRSHSSGTAGRMVCWPPIFQPGVHETTNRQNCPVTSTCGSFTEIRSPFFLYSRISTT